jgi:hypothetical protein
MINTLTRAATLGALMIAAIFASYAPAFSQAPTQAQRDAIKSQCRSDYMAHCSSVPPGGEASLQCLQKNMSSLSSGRGRQRRRCSGRHGYGGSRCSACRGSAGCARRHLVAADAAGRRTVRTAVGLRRRCPFDLRRRGTWRWAHRAVPRNQRCLAFAHVQGCAEPVRRSINRALPARCYALC